jgi:hypothetical protein
LAVQGDFLAIEMDVMLNGGVSADHLHSNVELWDRVIQEFVVYLRDYGQHAVQLQAEDEKLEDSSDRREEV